jgi:hypothetical protein
MTNQVTFEQVEQLVAQLPPPEQLKLVVRICEQLSAASPVGSTESEAEQLWRSRLQLAEELLAECEDIEDDSQGTSDAAEAIRRMREERIRQICQSDA